MFVAANSLPPPAGARPLRASPTPFASAGSGGQFLRAVAKNVRRPEMSAIIRMFASEREREPDLAAIAIGYWRARAKEAREVIARAIDRGELPTDADSDLLIETVLGPIYLRMLVTGGPLSPAFLTRVVDLALNGATRPADPGPAGY